MKWSREKNKIPEPRVLRFLLFCALRLCCDWTNRKKNVQQERENQKKKKQEKKKKEKNLLDVGKFLVFSALKCRYFNSIKNFEVGRKYK